MSISPSSYSTITILPFIKANTDDNHLLTPYNLPPTLVAQMLPYYAANVGNRNTGLGRARQASNRPSRVIPTNSSRVLIFTPKVIMQFRVYAMYNRAKWVLAFTFTCFIIQIGITLYIFGLYEYVLVISLQFGPWTVCAATQMPTNAAGTWLATIAFEGILFFFAVYKTVIHLLRLNHPWTRSGATEVLLRDNILYFLVIFSIYCLMAIAWNTFPVRCSVTTLLFSLRTKDLTLRPRRQVIWMEILSSLNIMATCTLGCRLILNIREVSYRHEECVNTQEIDFQLRELVDGLQQGVVSSGVDPANNLAPGRRDDSGDQAIEEESRQVVA
ncbi:hypothetical protein JAAARDRAFT_195285 [Jaapia argillacea MUCL 33604]|uniref:Uncharacterized protein n=1 Tax=Jaapia argillacea MUCL 33604 TaxID=933084 RepID=A0A067PXQ8_9AGAM|nr:hypothetical protein JAAARDRAFT_195285 [Jaapia argillacea MUCL 33604]